ncbi:MAG: methyltransferase domain-containing protein [Acidobacteriota bacterium]
MEEKKELAELGRAWMYEFDLGDGIKTRLLDEELRSIHRTREVMIQEVIDRFFPSGLSGRRCLDVACNEGYFSHLLYHRGAIVKGIDIREDNIRRAKAVREIRAFDAQRLEFERQDVFDVADPADSYDLTLCLGLIYHLEDPVGALRSIQRVTRRLCIVETQLTRQTQPIRTGWGHTGVTKDVEAGVAVFYEGDYQSNALASYQCLSFVPNEAAVRLFLAAAGFREVSRVSPPPDANPQYLTGDRGVFAAVK